MNALEAMIDKHGLVAVLSELASICDEKSGHIAQSYADAALAGRWARAARAVRRFSTHAAVVSVNVGQLHN